MSLSATWPADEALVRSDEWVKDVPGELSPMVGIRVFQFHQRVLALEGEYGAAVFEVRDRCKQVAIDEALTDWSTLKTLFTAPLGWAIRILALMFALGGPAWLLAWAVGSRPTAYSALATLSGYWAASSATVASLVYLWLGSANSRPSKSFAFRAVLYALVGGLPALSLVLAEGRQTMFPQAPPLFSDLLVGLSAGMVVAYLTVLTLGLMFLPWLLSAVAARRRFARDHSLDLFLKTTLDVLFHLGPEGGYDLRSAMAHYAKAVRYLRLVFANERAGLPRIARKDFTRLTDETTSALASFVLDLAIPTVETVAKARDFLVACLAACSTKKWGDIPADRVTNRLLVRTMPWWRLTRSVVASLIPAAVVVLLAHYRVITDPGVYTTALLGTLLIPAGRLMYVLDPNVKEAVDLAKLGLPIGLLNKHEEARKKE